MYSTNTLETMARPSSPMLVRWASKALSRSARTPPTVPAARLGGDVLALSPTDFGKLTADDTEKWGKVIRAANIKAE